MGGLPERDLGELTPVSGGERAQLRTSYQAPVFVDRIKAGRARAKYATAVSALVSLAIILGLLGITVVISLLLPKKHATA